MDPFDSLVEAIALSQNIFKYIKYNNMWYWVPRCPEFYPWISRRFTDPRWHTMFIPSKYLIVDIASFGNSALGSPSFPFHLPCSEGESSFFFPPRNFWGHRECGHWECSRGKECGHHCSAAQGSLHKDSGAPDDNSAKGECPCVWRWVMEQRIQGQHGPALSGSIGRWAGTKLVN